jgi:hypothetical protein
MIGKTKNEKNKSNNLISSTKGSTDALIFTDRLSSSIKTFNRPKEIAKTNLGPTNLKNNAILESLIKKTNQSNILKKILKQNENDHSGSKFGKNINFQLQTGRNHENFPKIIKNISSTSKFNSQLSSNTTTTSKEKINFNSNSNQYLTQINNKKEYSSQINSNQGSPTKNHFSKVNLNQMNQSQKNPTQSIKIIPNINNIYTNLSKRLKENKKNSEIVTQSNISITQDKSQSGIYFNEMIMRTDINENLMNQTKGANFYQNNIEKFLNLSKEKEKSQQSQQSQNTIQQVPIESKQSINKSVSILESNLYKQKKEMLMQTKTTKDHSKSTLRCSFSNLKNLTQLEVDSPEELHFIFVHFQVQNKNLPMKFDKSENNNGRIMNFRDLGEDTSVMLLRNEIDL